MNTPLSVGIGIASADAYRKISEARHIPLEEVHRRDICRSVSSLILDHELLKNGPLLRLEGRLLPLFGKQTGFYAEHHYLVYKDETGGEKVIDASWQQFLPEDTGKQLPRVLVASRAEFVDQATAAGMPVEALDFWRPLEEADSVVKVIL